MRCNPQMRNWFCHFCSLLCGIVCFIAVVWALFAAVAVVVRIQFSLMYSHILCTTTKFSHFHSFRRQTINWTKHNTQKSIMNLSRRQRRQKAAKQRPLIDVMLFQIYINLIALPMRVCVSALPMFSYAVVFLMVKNKTHFTTTIRRNVCQMTKCDWKPINAI